MADLNDRQKAFVAAYCECLNATKAAAKAGYSAKTANEQGSRLLANVSIRAEIDRILTERVMGPGEILARLGEQAKGDMSDFVTAVDIDLPDGKKGKTVMPDLAAALAAGKFRNVKKFKVGKDGISFELYDAKAALDTLAKVHGLVDTKRDGNDDDDDEEEDSDEQTALGDEAIGVEAELIQLAARDKSQSGGGS